jgi:hypothetical protein
MCGNRVEELESRVKELEASVEGLTDELVECKVRIRELEGAFEDEIGFVPEPTAGNADSSENSTQSGSEMLEPGDEDSDAAEASKGEASETADTEPDSDIIIA